MCSNAAGQWGDALAGLDDPCQKTHGETKEMVASVAKRDIRSVIVI